MAGRLIFHCDGNNFFASCECIEHPEWRDVPMAVAGDPKDRAGIVVAKNELAKKAGVKTTDTIWQARRNVQTSSSFRRITTSTRACHGAGMPFREYTVSWSLLRLTNRIWI